MTENILITGITGFVGSHLAELILEINYAISKMYKRNKQVYPYGSWDIADYYNHMADFFDHIERPHDADSLRLDAKTWEIEKGEKQ